MEWVGGSRGSREGGSQGGGTGWRRRVRGRGLLQRFMEGGESGSGSREGEGGGPVVFLHSMRIECVETVASKM